MNELLLLARILLFGGLLGTFFFGGLWFTVKKGIDSRHPALWFMGSFLIRIGVTILGFYAVSQHHWERAVVCLVGFLIARTIVTRVTKPLNPVVVAKEVSHEN